MLRRYKVSRGRQNIVKVPAPAGTATQIKCYNGTSSNGLGKTRRAMKKPERATPGKAVLQYASSLQSESRPSEHRQSPRASGNGHPDQVLQRHFIKRVREDAARDEKTGESYPGESCAAV